MHRQGVRVVPKVCHVPFVEEPDRLPLISLWPTLLTEPNQLCLSPVVNHFSELEGKAESNLEGYH